MTPEALAPIFGAHTPVDWPALPGRTNHRRAGVLVPLLFEPEPVILLTLRTAHLRRHGGEVSFPGGRPEPEDADLMATALREAREELGVGAAEVVGRLASMPLYTSDWRLEPYVALLPDQPLTPDPGEVAEVLRLPLAEALGAAKIDAIATEYRGELVLSPTFTIRGHVVFGGTAHTLYELLLVAAVGLGRRPPPLVKGRLTWAELGVG